MSKASWYTEIETSEVVGLNGINYKYRELGPAGDRPIVLFQHFRGNLENWDPALIDALARKRRVVVFDNVGIGGTDGTTPRTFGQMADDTLIFLDALSLADIDLLGFSIGSFVAQEVALTRPAVVHRIVLASTAPQGAPGMHGWSPEIIRAVGRRETDAAGFLQGFFRDTQTSRDAGAEFLGRIYAKTERRDPDPSWDSITAQYDAVLKWGTPNAALLERIRAIKQPVFVTNGDDDRMILPWYSHLTAALLPDARVKIYPDAAHGFLFQHAEEFAADVLRFLAPDQAE